MGRYLFVLIPLLAVVIGGWMVTSALQHPAATPDAPGRTKRRSTPRRVEPYRSPLPVVDPLAAVPTDPPNESAVEAPSGSRWTAAQRRGARYEAFAHLPPPDTFPQADDVLPWDVLLTLDRLYGWSHALDREVIAALEAVALANGTLPTHDRTGLSVPLARTLLWRRCARRLAARLLRSRTWPTWADADLRDPVCARAAAVLTELDDADPGMALASSRQR